MDQLPLEMNLKILNHLDLSELMALRLVCKKFECIVKEVKIRELIFVRHNYFWQTLHRLCPEENFWFFADELKEISATFRYSKHFINGSFFSDGPFNFRFLKQLSIESFGGVGFGLELLNRLQHLEQLEIGFDGPLESEQIKKQAVPCLFLARLKTLTILCYCNPNGLEIDAPKLRALQLPRWCKTTSDLTSLQFKHAKSIKFVSVENYLKHQNLVKKFSEIEHLETCNVTFKLSGANR